MVTVIFVLPGWSMLLDGFIEKTSIDFLGTKKAARKAGAQSRRIGTAATAAAAGSGQVSGASGDTGVTGASGMETAEDSSKTSGDSEKQDFKE